MSISNNGILLNMPEPRMRMMIFRFSCFREDRNFIHQQYADVFKTPLTRKVSFLYGSTTKEL